RRPPQRSRARLEEVAGISPLTGEVGRYSHLLAGSSTGKVNALLGRSGRKDSPMSETVDFVQRYVEGNIPWDSGVPEAELVRLLDAGTLAGKTVLEIGCGTGTNAVELARRGFVVTAMD